MNLKEKFSTFNEKSDISRDLKDEISKLPANEDLTKEILYMLNNKHTKVVLDEDIKNSYYVYLNDTIYLSNREKAKNNSSRVVLTAHEVRHSIQSKFLQIINFVLSNVELISFVINIILFIFKKFSMTNILVYLGIVVISIIPRMILEFDAVINSIKITRKYLKDKINDKKLNKIISIYKFKINILMPLFIFNLIFGKIFRIVILVLAFYFFM